MVVEEEGEEGRRGRDSGGDDKKVGMGEGQEREREKERALLGR